MKRVPILCLFCVDCLQIVIIELNGCFIEPGQSQFSAYKQRKKLLFKRMRFSAIGMCIIIIFLSWLQEWIPIKGRQFQQKKGMSFDYNKIYSTERLHFSYPLKFPIFAKKGLNSENFENSFVDPILYRYCALSSLVLYINTVYDDLSPHSSCYLQEDFSVLAISFRS